MTAGSSVPEAARAADRHQRWVEAIDPHADGISQAHFDAVMALADAEVAAAVAEERATTGEVQVGWWGPYGLIPGGMDNDPVPSWRPVYVRAALASPGEGG